MLHSGDLSAGMGPVLVVVLGVLVFVVPVVPLPFLLTASGDLSVETGPVQVVVVVRVWVLVVVPPPFMFALVIALMAIVPYVVAEPLCQGMRE